MKLISLGDVNKNLIYILVGGISKLVAELILYFFANDVKMKRHPFILGINAGIGMMFAFIPDLIVKYKMKVKLTEKDEQILYNDYDFIEHKRKFFTKRALKLIIIFSCCILDYIQKILTFLYSIYIINNLWIFDIIFLGAFSLWILRLQLYKHQYLSCLLMIVFGILLNAIDVEYDNTLIYKLLLSFLIEIFYNLAVVLAKYGMDVLFMTPFEITFYEGTFAFILNIVFLLIATNTSMVDPPKLIDLAAHEKYEGKEYLDNFYGYWEKFKGTEILAFIVLMFSRALFNLFGHILAKDFTPSHVIFLLMVGEVFLAFKGDFNAKKIGSLVIILIEIFMLLIFTETIELNFWGLERNTRKNIKEREKKLADLDSKSDYSERLSIELQKTGTLSSPSIITNSVSSNISCDSSDD